jgi:hypothetical protein
MKDILLTAVVLSYNRPRELLRCLNSIDIEPCSSFKVFINDDFSPRRKEIAGIVSEFKAKSNYLIVDNHNNTNLGFDRSYYNSIKANLDSQHLLFITDDDTFISGGLLKLYNFLKVSKPPLLFTKYYSSFDGRYYRRPLNTAHKSNYENLLSSIDNLILLSGMCINTDSFIDFDIEKTRDTFYTQVYVGSRIILNDGCQYLDMGLIKYIGDGDNGFKSKKKNINPNLISDRNNPLSNIEYNKGLVEVYHRINEVTNNQLIKDLSKNYHRRKFGSFVYAASFGKRSLIRFYLAIRRLNLRHSFYSELYLVITLLLGYRSANKFYRLLLKFKR